MEHKCAKQDVIDIMREDTKEIRKDVKTLLKFDFNEMHKDIKKNVAFRLQILGGAMVVSLLIGCGFQEFYVKYKLNEMKNKMDKIERSLLHSKQIRDNIESKLGVK